MNSQNGEGQAGADGGAGVDGSGSAGGAPAKRAYASHSNRVEGNWMICTVTADDGTTYEGRSSNPMSDGEPTGEARTSWKMAARANAMAELDKSNG